MVHDRAARYQQALQAGELANIGETVHAIGNALADCRHAGVDPEAAVRDLAPAG